MKYKNKHQLKQARVEVISDISLLLLVREGFEKNSSPSPRLQIIIVHIFIAIEVIIFSFFWNIRVQKGAEGCYD